jgi:cytochrome c-type biogenesis protein CcmE
MTLVAVILGGVAIAGALALRAFQENVMFYFDPTKVANGEVKVGQRFRLGGMVVKDSVKRTPGTLDISFAVTDYRHTVPVRYSNVLPDLFKEGSGMVAHGRLNADGVFIADEVLAKHDENYMPPEVTKSLAAGKAAAGGDGNN